MRFNPDLRSRLAARLYFFLEFVEISLFSPNGPGPLMRWLFKFTRRRLPHCSSRSAFEMVAVVPSTLVSETVNFSLNVRAWS